MANRFYPKFRKAAINGGNINLADPAVVVKLILVDLADYVYNDAHEFLSAVSAGARVAISPALTAKTISDLAVFDSADLDIPGVTGDQFEAIIGFIDTGNEATSRLIWFQDSNITGLPLTPNGQGVKVTVDVLGWWAF